MATGGVWHVQHCCPLFLASAALPAACPVCRERLDPSSAAVRVPSPFRSASDHRRAVLLRPTAGEFCQYRGGHLHIGASDCCGRVAAFDADGLRLCPAEEWAQCLVIPLPAAGGGPLSPGEGAGDSETPRSPGSRQWDDTLAHLLSSSDWTAESYDDVSRNCFSFVLAFLERAGALPSPAPWTRERFAAELVLPVSRRAAKYLTLSRTVARQGWCALGEPGGQPR